MLTLPADIILEKNKLYSDEAFIELLEWQISETGSTVRIANYNEDVKWDGHTWSKFRFEGAGENDTGGDSAVTVQISVSAVDKAIQGYIEGLTNGGIGDTVIYRRVHSAYLTQSAVMSASFEIIDIDAGPSDEWVVFNLGQENFFLSQFPANVYRRDVCRYRPSQTDVCSYVNNSVCDRTFAYCIYLGQESVFGGQPGIPGGAFDLYDISISVGTSPGAIVIRGYNPDVTHSGTVNANVCQVTIAGYNPNINDSNIVHANVGQITIDGYSCTVTKLTQIDVGSAGAITIAGYNASSTAETIISASSGTLTIAAHQPTVASATQVNCSAGAITIDGYPLQINAKTTTQFSLGAITIAGYNPTVETGTLIETSLGAIVVLGYDTYVACGVSANATLGLITIDGYDATVLLGAGIQDTGGDFIRDTGGDIIEEPD